MGDPILRDGRPAIVVDVSHVIAHVPLSVQIPDVILGEPQCLWMVPRHPLVTQSPFLGLATVAKTIVRGLTPLSLHLWVGLG